MGCSNLSLHILQNENWMDCPAVHIIHPSLRLTLPEMRHQQTKATPICVNNSTVVGIVNNTIKQQRSHAMDKRYYWIVDQVTLGNF